MRIATFALCALILAGCAQYQGKPITPSAVDREAETAPTLAPNQGLVAFSMASDPHRGSSLLLGDIEGDPGYIVTLQVENIATGARFQFRENSNFVAFLTLGLANSDDFEMGSVYTHSLPAGDYRITNFRVYYNNGSVEKTWYGRAEFSIPFQVNEQGRHYIGEWRCLPRKAENIFGMSIASGCTFAVSDEFERDAPLLKAKFPSIDWSQLSNDTMRAGDAPPELVTFR
ncbi:MAG: hypothetical protein AAGM38_08785 [Pseudomonadota bacterium]